MPLSFGPRRNLSLIFDHVLSSLRLLICLFELVILLQLSRQMVQDGVDLCCDEFVHLLDLSGLQDVRCYVLV